MSFMSTSNDEHCHDYCNQPQSFQNCHIVTKIAVDSRHALITPARYTVQDFSIFQEIFDFFFFHLGSQMSHSNGTGFVNFCESLKWMTENLTTLMSGAVSHLSLVPHELVFSLRLVCLTLLYCTWFDILTRCSLFSL